MIVKKLLTSTALASVFLSGPAFASNAKFAATYDTDVVFAEIAVDGTSGPDSDSAVTAEHELASLKVAQWKELLVGVSGQVNLVTFTQAKGKNNAGASTAIAEGAVGLGVLVVPKGTGSCSTAWANYKANNENNAFIAPGPVTFASRRQELTVDVDLDLVDNDPNDDVTADDLSIEGSVTVALGLDTTAAHHFNFVAENLSSGEYDILACYDLSALAEVGGADIDADTAANSRAAIGPRIVTVQEVRATKTGIIDETGVQE